MLRNGIKHVRGIRTKVKVKPLKRENIKLNNDLTIPKNIFKTGEQIKTELTKRFEKDGIEIDEKFIEKMKEEGESRAKLAEKYSIDPYGTAEELTLEELNGYIDSVVNACRDNGRVDRTKLRNFLSDDMNIDDSDALVEAFQDAQIGARKGSERVIAKTLPVLLEQLNKMSNMELNARIPLDKWVSLYEASVLRCAGGEFKHPRSVYLAGKLLYDALGREFGSKVNARPDPVNEMLFIESCLECGDVKRGEELWFTRRGKDVAGERFWEELGVRVQLYKYAESGDEGALDTAVEMVNEMRRASGGGGDGGGGKVNTEVLVEGVRKCLDRGNAEDARWFWEEVLVNCARDGVAAVETRLRDTVVVADASKISDVFAYYNSTGPVTHAQVASVFGACVGGKQWLLAVQVVADTVDIVDGEEDSLVEHLREELATAFDHPGRELFLHALREMEAGDSLSAARDTLVHALEAIRRDTRAVATESTEEAQLLAEIALFLERTRVLASRAGARSRAGAESGSRAAVEDILESVRAGAPLTAGDGHALLRTLVRSRSQHALELASRVLRRMNTRSTGVNTTTTTATTFPPADARCYAVLVGRVLSGTGGSVVSFARLDALLSLMAQHNVPLDEPLANSILVALVALQQPSRAVAFAQQHLFVPARENPAALPLPSPLSLPLRTSSPSSGKNAYTAALLAYAKLAVTGSLPPETFHSTLASLRLFVRNILHYKLHHNTFTMQETIGTLLSYGDYPSAICVVEHYGRDRAVPFDLHLAVRAKLEASLTKAQRHVVASTSTDHSHGHGHGHSHADNYRKRFGLHPLLLSRDLKTRPDSPWQDTARVIYEYASLFGFRPVVVKEDPFALLVSDTERARNSEFFDNQLKELRLFYDTDARDQA